MDKLNFYATAFLISGLVAAFLAEVLVKAVTQNTLAGIGVGLLIGVPITALYMKLVA